MKKIFGVFFIFIAIIAIMTYGSGKSFSFKVALENFSTMADPPEQPDKTDFNLEFSAYNDYVDEDENVFKKIGAAFSWLGGVFATLFEYIKFITLWIVYAIKYFVYIIQFIGYIFGDVLCGF